MYINFSIYFNYG